MNRTVLLCVILAAATLAAAGAELAQVRSVYLLPMGNGLDQYLANRLANAGFFQVVADPKKADAIFTDRLGAAFEARLAELFPEPPPPKPVEPPKKAEKKEKEEEAKPGLEIPTAPEPARMSTFARGKGTIFLVSGKSRTVLWSVYEQPKNTLPAELDRTAQRIVERLKRELKPK